MTDQSHNQAGIAQAAEHGPSKSGVAGSNPAARSNHADIAQMAERLSCKEDVAGSMPAVGSISQYAFPESLVDTEYLNTFLRLPVREREQLLLGNFKCEAGE